MLGGNLARNIASGVSLGGLNGTFVLSRWRLAWKGQMVRSNTPNGVGPKDSDWSNISFSAPWR